MTSRPPDSLGALTGAAFAGESFAGDAFATDDANGDDGLYSANEPLPDISDFDVEEDEDDEPVPAADSASTAPNITPPRGVHSFFSDSFGSSPTDEANLAHRREVGRNLSLLDKAVEDLRYLAINRSHNQPPELVDEIPVSNKVIDELKASIEEVKTEVRAVAPNIANLQRQSSIFQMVLDGCKSIAGQLVIGGVLTTIVTDSLKGDFVILGTLQTALANTIDALSGWLKYLSSLGLS